MNSPQSNPSLSLSIFMQSTHPALVKHHLSIITTHRIGLVYSIDIPRSHWQALPGRRLHHRTAHLASDFVASLSPRFDSPSRQLSTYTISIQMPKAGFYAVAAGRVPGVYTTWSETENQVKGHPGAKYKKFASESQAISYIAEHGAPRSSGASRRMSGSSIKQIPSVTASSSTLGKVNTIVSTSSSSEHGVSRAATTKSSSTSTSIPSVVRSSRASSPPVHATEKELSEAFRSMANKGWKFSRRLPHSLVVYTDGSGLGNGKAGARAGLGVWWGDTGDAVRSNLSERVPGPLQTNNRGEILSVIRALETCPYPDLPLEIRTDSQYTIMCMTTYLPSWLKNGFMTSGNARTKVKNADMIKHLLVLLRRRKPGALVRFKYVAGHAGIEGNEGADRLARIGAAMLALPDRSDWLDPDKECETETKAPSLSDIGVEVDDNWLMTPDELTQFEKDLEVGS